MVTFTSSSVTLSTVQSIFPALPCHLSKCNANVSNWCNLICIQKPSPKKLWRQNFLITMIQELQQNEIRVNVGSIQHIYCNNTYENWTLSCRIWDLNIKSFLKIFKKRFEVNFGYNKNVLFVGNWEHQGEGNGTPLQYSFAWKIPWMEEPGRLQSMGSLRVGHDWATSLSVFTFMHWRRKWQPTPVFLPGESQGWLPSMGLHRVGHDWRDLAAAAAAGNTKVDQRKLKIRKQSNPQTWES